MHLSPKPRIPPKLTLLHEGSGRLTFLSSMGQMAAGLRGGVCLSVHSPDFVFSTWRRLKGWERPGLGEDRNWGWKQGCSGKLEGQGKTSELLFGGTSLLWKSHLLLEAPQGYLQCAMYQPAPGSQESSWKDAVPVPRLDGQHPPSK